MQVLNASTNGGDASRVGILRQKFTDKRVISAACEPVCMNLCLNARRETRLLKKCPFSKFGLHFANN